jgi:uncharacterized protein (DUF488 family)
MRPPGSQIFTIGHSTHPAEQFRRLLLAHNISQLADVRTIPKSRRHPQYNADALEALLAAEGIIYRHFPALGGLRKPRSDSLNTAWQHAGFRGYADHMQTTEFARAIDDLLMFAQHGTTAIMCAEAMWWQCHRRLLSDALLARGVSVCHIFPNAESKPHDMSEFARVDGQKVAYPGLV